MNALWLKLMAHALLVVTPFAARSDAATAYPTKPLRLIVSALPGTPPDALSRIIAEPLAGTLGKPVVVDNRAGGSGTIGIGIVVKASPDGHTLGTIGLPLIVAPYLVAGATYDLVRDLTPVTQLVWTANILVVRPASAMTSVAEFVALAKTRPGQLSHASAGNASPSHLAAELFKHRARIEVRHIPYKGITAGLAAVMGGEIDITFAGIATALPLVQAGKLRALAGAGARRLPALPDLPTLAELGYAGSQLNEWYGVVVPAGTPPSIVARLASEMAQIVASPQTNTRLALLGLYPADKPGPEAFSTLIRLEAPRWKQIVRDVGIRAQ